MKIILAKSIESLGGFGDIVEVKDGYARNYLIPKGVALKATNSNLTIFEEKKKIEQLKQKKLKKQALNLSKRLAKTSCTIAVKTENDKMFGAVTSIDIVKSLREKDINFDKTDILLKEPIRELGVYNVAVKLHPEVTTEVKIWVVKE